MAVINKVTLPNGQVYDIGGSGSGDLSYVHTQSTVASTWTVTHNLGKYPSVTVVDSSNNEVIGDIQYTNTNSLKITFSSGFSGKAYCN